MSYLQLFFVQIRDGGGGGEGQNAFVQIRDGGGGGEGEGQNAFLLFQIDLRG